ncbi:MAG: hypothetical protein R2784_17245 [Saprospiraceae bacterium]
MHLFALNPLEHIFAAINRTDMSGEPKGGWQPQEKLKNRTAFELLNYSRPTSTTPMNTLENCCPVIRQILSARQASTRDWSGVKFI